MLLFLKGGTGNGNENIILVGKVFDPLKEYSKHVQSNFNLKDHLKYKGGCASVLRFLMFFFLRKPLLIFPTLLRGSSVP